MSRWRLFETCALNIAISDSDKHEESYYESLMKALYALKQPVVTKGEERLLIGELRPLNQEGVMFGILYRFVKIDDMRWVNVEERRPASQAEKQRISIPPNLEANLREFPFIFDPKVHRLAFLSKSGNLRLSPLQIKKLFSVLVQDFFVRENFGIVAVNIEQEPSAIEEILASPNMRSLEITICKPNGENIGDLKVLFGENLEKMRASKARLWLQADESKSLHPSEDIKRLAMSASSNGEVEAKVSKNDSVHTISTNQYPIVEKKMLPPSVGLEKGFLQTAMLLLSRFVGK